MARDDYNVIVFKILVYLYAVMKNNRIFNQKEFDKAIGRKDINEEYLLRVYKLMEDEGLIKNALFAEVWGNDLIALFEEKDLIITAQGIRYLEDNDKMKEVGQFLKQKVDTIIKLALEIGLIF
ncbi:YjcQ protein [Pseudobutyrivibrio sp. OR37]|uniref:YjcQ family protein n=1 Tax=Pseudobutyrivibrio sp. OR37 TaxID=1798186 RepID=UPI0008E3FB18|nr:YjcQ family protein [Pseudobutyrivibrio sp. OR37]SFI35661.1 YjcQ protein [Pseudobutyrivibrio sp. OR37]